MIVARIVGGLGNQLFQYAFARTCANRLKTQLYLDTRDLDSDPHRKFKFLLGDFELLYKKIPPDFTLDLYDGQRSSLYQQLKYLLKGLIRSDLTILEGVFENQCPDHSGLSSI